MAGQKHPSSSRYPPPALFAPGLTLQLLAACVTGTPDDNPDGMAAAQDGGLKKDGPGVSKDGPGSSNDGPVGAAAFGPFIAIAKGSFGMGAGPAEKCSTLADPETRHQVTLTRGFEMQITPPTTPGPWASGWSGRGSIPTN